MVRNRAWLRHHISRLKSKRKTYRTAVAKTLKVVGKIYQAPSSCYICGNQRINHGANMQERCAKSRHTD